MHRQTDDRLTLGMKLIYSFFSKEKSWYNEQTTKKKKQAKSKAAGSTISLL